MIIDHDDRDLLAELRRARAENARLSVLLRMDGETHVEHARRVLWSMTRTPESVAACHRATLDAEVVAYQRARRERGAA